MKCAHVATNRMIMYSQFDLRSCKDDCNLEVMWYLHIQAKATLEGHRAPERGIKLC